MSRAKTYHVSCLNLAVHPHDKPDTYVRLMKALGQIKYAKVYGDTCGTIRYLQEIATGNGGTAYMTGMFVRFTHLDPNSGWFNTEDKSNVDTETDGRPILPINLKPNRTETNFIFFPTSDCHKLFFISDKFSPVLAQKFLKRLAGDKDIANEFGDINIEIMTTSDAIQQVLQLNSISSLLIKVNMPNADDLDDCD